MKNSEDTVAVIAVQGKRTLDWLYIEKWCLEHGTLGVLAQAKAAAAQAWEDDDAS